MIFKARQVMNPDPVIVDSEISVTEAAKKLIHSGQNILIVLDREKIAGIIEPRSVLRYTYTEGFRPNQTPVSEITNSEIVFARPNTSLEDILTIMMELKQDTLPVVDTKLVGSINIFKILKFQQKTKPIRLIPPLA